MSYFHEQIVKILESYSVIKPWKMADEIVDMLEGEGVLSCEDDEEEE